MTPPTSTMGPRSPCSPANSFRAAPRLETLPPSPPSIPPSILGLGSGLHLGVLSNLPLHFPLLHHPKEQSKGFPFSPSLHPTRLPSLSICPHPPPFSLVPLAPEKCNRKTSDSKGTMAEQTCKGSGSQTMFLGGMRYELSCCCHNNDYLVT